MGGVTTLHWSSDHVARFEAQAATREAAWVKWLIVGVSLAFFAVFLLLPLAAFAIAWAMALPPVQATVLLIFSALPTASSAYVLAARMGYPGGYVAALVTLSTLLGLLSLPLALELTRRL